jgi:two-component system, NarL family, response regulator NreC
MAIKIMLAEDHARLRTGLQSLIECRTDMEVVGQAENGWIAVEQAAELKPDVIVMDIAMPDMNGIEATRLINAGNPDIKIIALSSFDRSDFVLEMFKAGASGYLLKDNLFDNLVKAIQTVVQDDSYLCSEVARAVVRDFQKSRTSLTNLDKDEIVLIKLLTQARLTNASGA